MRASRLLTIQMLLETGGRMSAQALADALEVSVRTLYRDVDQLAAAGVPIYAERGRNGGFQLMQGWTTRLTGFTAAEAQAVFMTGLAGPAAQLGLGDEVADAQLKLLAALPVAQRGDAQRLQSRFHLDTLDWYRAVEPTPYLAEVASAVWASHQLQVDYESWRGEVRRTLHPLGLVLKAGAWYLVAGVDGAPRTYRIANIRALRVLDARSERPRRFDLAAYWVDAMQRFEHDLYAGKATVLATPAGLRELAKLSAALARAVTGRRGSPDKDGRTRLVIPIETVAQAAAQLLPLAPEVVAVAPPALVDAIAARLRQIVRSYASAKSRKPARQKKS
jgi:predicted DNA-binding transcriptional regulator YafY